MLGRYCGQHSPPDIRSSGRYLWIKFVTDGELEAVGFSASYNFTAGTSATFPLCMWLLWERLGVASIVRLRAQLVFPLEIGCRGGALSFGGVSLHHQRVCVFVPFLWAGGGRE